MNLKRLVLFGGIILVSGGCATDRVVGASETQRPSPVVELLAGHASAVEIRAPDRPAGAYIRIRCGSTPSPDHAPLFIVDGRRMTHGDIAASGLNPARIAEISILKGPAAVERYGPAAAQGVVLVTLKH